MFDVTARDQLMAQIECHQFIVEMDFNSLILAINSIVTIFPLVVSIFDIFQ